MKKTLFVLLFALIAPRSFAADCSLSNFILEREVVYAGERVEVVLTGTCTFSDVPYDALVRRDGKLIVIDLQRPAAGSNQPPLSTWGERVMLPSLFAGTYSVVVRSRGEELERKTLVMRHSAPRMVPTFGTAGDEVIIPGFPMDEECPLNSPSCSAGVYFGQIPAEFRYVDDGHIVAVVPAGLSGRVPVTVRDQTGQIILVDEFRAGRGFEGDFERVLFPLNFFGAGAHGSEWRTNIVVRNDGPVAVRTIPEFWMQPNSPVLPIANEYIPAGGRGQFVLRQRDGGEFLHVPRGLEKELSYASHLVDRSRSATDLGSEIPVVHAEETANTIRLLGVPTASNFRAKLRVYDFDPVNGRLVTVTVREPNGNVLATRKLTLTGAPVCANAPCFADRPPFAALDLDLLDGVRGAESANVTIESDLNDGRIWAFVSVTNNETQNVTLYTPQHGQRPAGE
ncbi:MAG TPA: IPT/TIG domain-containing protein [Thermoanaerobaculia bacterium]|nr:IPT/TIG domain-containing protein [Thermoanaerobaculia bacterium]